MLTRALKTTFACILASAVAVPATAAAAVAEVGLLEKTTPATVPSCTAGPVGSAQKAIEAEKAKEQEKRKNHVAGGKRHAAGKKASRDRARRHTNARKASSRRRARTAARSRPRARSAGDGSSEVAQTAEEATKPATEETAASPEAPCLAVSRTTGYQMKVGAVNHPLVISGNGRIVAWTIQLGRPTATQIKFFDENEGGEASAGIALLSPVKNKGSSTPEYHLLAQSPVIKLEPYFGMTAQFPLAQTIKAKKGDLVALTVPTWAPALALGFGKNTSWRASRQKGQCSVTNAQSAHTELKSNVQYFCQYRTARLTYSATLISTP